MNVYEVEFRASLQVAAKDAHQAACIATSAISQEPKLVYIRSVTEKYERAWVEPEPSDSEGRPYSDTSGQMEPI